jgi:hypothetical protein
VPDEYDRGVLPALGNVILSERSPSHRDHARKLSTRWRGSSPENRKRGDPPCCDTRSMSASTVLQFDSTGQVLRFPAHEVGSVTSPFTGRVLRKLETTLTVAPEDATVIRELVTPAPVTDVEGSLWSGNLDSESYTNDGPHNLTITWTESENVRAESVEFEGLSLRPTPAKYEEHVNEDGSIAVTFQATLSKEESDRLRSLLPAKPSEARYWPVIRWGVSNEPRSMRLGRVLWQPLDDDRVGHDITLVDEAFDSSAIANALGGLAGEPQIGNLIHRLSALLVQFERLLVELEAGGAVAPEGIERIQASANTLGAARRYLFFEVADLSKW